MLVNRCVEEHLRRINRLDESEYSAFKKENTNMFYLVMQQASAYENVNDQYAYTTSYKKDTDSVILRQSKYEVLTDSQYSEIKDDATPPRPPKISTQSQLHNS
jgi:hypothetical protein